MTQLQQKFTLPAGIAQKLEVMRRRTLKVRIGTALIAAVGVLLAAMAVAMLIDWLATLYDFRWRAALTFTAWMAAAVTLLAWVLAAWRHTRGVDRVATKVDREIPELEERWSTVTALSSNGNAAEIHPAMFQQVSSEAQSWTPRVETDRVVPLDGLIRALLFLTAITSVLGFAVLFAGHRTTVLLKRFWQPYAAISATELTDVTDRKVIGRGESLEISANIVGSPVEQASLLLESQTGDPKTLTLVPRGESQDHLKHRLRSVKEPLRYRLRAGDGQTPWYEIIVADRPQLADVRLQLTPPAYTRKNPKVLHKLPRRIRTLEGSHLEIALKPKQSLKTLQLKLGAERTEQLTADKDGWYRWETTLTKSFSFQPLLTEEHGLTNLRPPTCEIVCRPDKPPVVKILTPNNEMAVRPDDTIPITFVASDDVGVHEAELIVYDESHKIDGKPSILDRIPVPLDDQQGAVKVKVTIPLDLSRYKTTDGSELSFSIRVREDRGQEKSRVTSQNSRVTSSEDKDMRTGEDAGAVPNDSAAPNDSMAKPMTEKPITAIPEAVDSAKDDSDRLAAKEAASDPAKASNASTDSGSSQPSGENSTPQQAAESSSVTPNSKTTPSTEESPLSNNATLAKTQAEPSQESEVGKDSAQAMAGKAESLESTPQEKSEASSKKSPSAEKSSSPAPSNPMTKRSLDTESAQSSSSKRMRLKIDQWAGSYDGQQRQKLEIAIAPRLEELDRALEKAQVLSRSVLDSADAAQPWVSKHDRDIQRADEQIEAAIQVVEALEKQTYDTPYAFIGLQLVDINQAHIGPARRDFWKSLQTDGTVRMDTVRNGWQHTVRARELLVLLTERFERTQAEFKLAESVEKIKKMYRVFVEDSMELLRPDDSEGGRYSRKRAEFDLDEEYLERLEEVLKMRNEMRAELARLLADDPRLLRRFLDAQRNRQVVLRNELDRLTEQQSELNRETRAWKVAEEDQRPQLAAILLGRHIESSQDLAIAAADLHDRFETWSPLGKEVEDVDFRATAKVLQEISTATRELSADGQKFVSESTRAKKVESEGTELAKNEFDPEKAAEQISSDAQQLYERFTQLEVLLRQIGSRQDRVDIAYFATNRLLETRRLVEQTSAWIRQLKQQQAGNYHRSAEVAQYRLAMQTDAMAGKLANLEQTFTGLLQNEGGQLPESIAEKSRGLLAALDEQAAPNQLAAVYALRRDQMPRATSRQESALESLELAGKLYDEMIEAAIIELDKLPVQDPIASLLDDPTLDELLRELEQELPINEALGIPQRPTNLQIMGDWLRPGGDNSMMTGANRQRMMDQMRRQQKMRQRQLDKAYQRAIARALKEMEAEDLVKNMPKLARETADWNRLASQLEDDVRQGRDKAPPERYRRAIEQYFRQVSGSGKGSK